MVVTDATYFYQFVFRLLILNVKYTGNTTNFILFSFNYHSIPMKKENNSLKRNTFKQLFLDKH